MLTPTAISRTAPTAPIVGDRHAVAARALQVARRTALGVLGDHAAADDVAQEVAITALRRIDGLRDPEALDAWLHRIAVRCALKEARRGTVRRAAEIASHRRHERTAPPPGAELAAGDDLEAAIDLLAGLPARQRAALTLRYVHDLGDDAIATALGCRVGTVRSLLSRGRSALRDTDQTTPPGTTDDTRGPRC